MMMMFLGLPRIIKNDSTISPDKFPTWHTKTRSLRKAVTFAMTMTDDPEVVPYLILPEKMGEYLWNTMLDEVNVIGIIREKHKCELEYQKDPFEVRIKKGWREVVGINGFKVGDRLLFNTSSIYDDHTFFVRSCK
ncbi:hypothetical protein L195_g052860 [Trifolium pratense]|uniref:TF-B3 domain-containing protein n=1 Tax=Trifolium pratense TaxID=57577 RepID=A0A2K3K7G9_TRIPR|nr:hypothetical protein L195_g052860 [Trifolium pratense]